MLSHLGLFACPPEQDPNAPRAPEPREWRAGTGDPVGSAVSTPPLAPPSSGAGCSPYSGREPGRGETWLGTCPPCLFGCFPSLRLSFHICDVKVRAPCLRRLFPELNELSWPRALASWVPDVVPATYTAKLISPPQQACYYPQITDEETEAQRLSAWPKSHTHTHS